MVSTQSHDNFWFLIPFLGRGVGSKYVVKWQDQDTATYCNALECSFRHTHNHKSIKVCRQMARPRHCNLLQCTGVFLQTHTWSQINQKRLRNSPHILGNLVKNLCVSIKLETPLRRISTTHTYRYTCKHSVSANKACHALFEWCVALYCNLLHCVAVCSLLRNTLQHTATHCNTPQHTTTRFIQRGCVAPKMGSLPLPRPRPASFSLSCSCSCSRFVPVLIFSSVCLSVCLSVSVSLSLSFPHSLSLPLPLRDAPLRKTRAARSCPTCLCTTDNLRYNTSVTK